MKREIRILVPVYLSNVCYLLLMSPYFSSSFKTTCV